MTEAFGLNVYLDKAESLPIIDVRSPLEFQQGHIPSAYNVPILDNENRAIVGTVYKKEGNESAVIKGFELVGPLFSKFIIEAKKIAPDKKVLIHCWRGGLRSRIMAWVLQSAGFETYTLIGGYKSYRRWALELFDAPRNIIILGGMTGTGKTDLLKEIKESGEQTIDLEGMAHHKGSAFGGLGMEPPPTNEQFENDLALQLFKTDEKKNLWLEDESQNIGKIKIPDSLYKMMRQAKVVKVNIPFEVRVNRLVEEYTNFPKEDLREGTMKIAKRLGNLRLNQSLECLETNDMKKWVEMMLEYYDKAYLYGLSQRESNTISEIDIELKDLKGDVRRIIDSVNASAERVH